MAKNKKGAKYLLVEVPDEHLRNVLRLNKKKSSPSHVNNENLHVVPGKVVSLHHPQGRPRHPKGVGRPRHPHPQRPMMQRPQWLRPQMMRPQMVRPQITRHQMMTGLAMQKKSPPVDPEFAKKYYPAMAWDPTLLWDPELMRPGATPQSDPGPKIVWQPKIMWLPKPTKHYRKYMYSVGKPKVMGAMRKPSGMGAVPTTGFIGALQNTAGMGRVPRVRAMGLMGGNGPKPMGGIPGNPGGLQPKMSANGEIEYIDYSDIDLGPDYEYVQQDPLEDLELDESGNGITREAFLE